MEISHNLRLQVQLKAWSRTGCQGIHFCIAVHYWWVFTTEFFSRRFSRHVGWEVSDSLFVQPGCATVHQWSGFSSQVRRLTTSQEALWQSDWPLGWITNLIQASRNERWQPTILRIQPSELNGGSRWRALSFPVLQPWDHASAIFWASTWTDRWHFPR